MSRKTLVGGCSVALPPVEDSKSFANTHPVWRGCAPQMPPIGSLRSRSRCRRVVGLLVGGNSQIPFLGGYPPQNGIEYLIFRGDS